MNAAPHDPDEGAILLRQTVNAGSSGGLNQVVRRDDCVRRRRDVLHPMAADGDVDIDSFREDELDLGHIVCPVFSSPA